MILQREVLRVGNGDQRMAHFGLICPALSGHLNPMTTLGRELKRRGHRITLIGRPDAQKKTESAGLEFAVVGEKDSLWVRLPRPLRSSDA
jgi:UDP:flavonoid glycosyltransferase YjiC (YdhE family)